jgi:putative FmdB family regulatory protein
MPIYEYRCKSCGKVIEVIQQFRDRPLRKCRTCSGRLEKLISRTAFHLKGGGWYAEGYNKGAAKKSGGSDGSASTSGDSKCAASGSGS